MRARPLARRSRGAPRPAARARRARLGARLADALAGIHGTGLVHRDLKPSNILIDAAGPRIIDFGIARALGAHRLTRSGQAVGTPAHMSPEQASGHDHEPPGDVFALGGVLVFAATGHGPFPGGRAADVLYRVRYEDPDLSHVPAALVPVLERCLAKDPAERPRPVALSQEWGGPDGAFAALLPARSSPTSGGAPRRCGTCGRSASRAAARHRPARGPVAATSAHGRRRRAAGGGGGRRRVGRDPGTGLLGPPRAAAPSRAPGSAPNPCGSTGARRRPH
ncbi:serine/threonine-protein kinase [Streptomyces diastatochromogenes]|nr:serine/threonine-protein kinase [Streptomyces diastatochromogenes]